MAERYDHKAVEQKWQERWREKEAFKTPEDSSKEKLYVLDMFPYPSGEGLHVGHPKGYIATDVYARFMRAKGKAVLHPMGWDAFGLPAENFALKNKVHPRVAVEKNIANFKQQLAHIGFDYDWDREINTTDPAYYKWTQWIFLQLFNKGLAELRDEAINWCPSCMTGLANEDLDGAECERCGTTVEKKKLPQWVLKITAYADRMLEDLGALQWPEHIKEAQRNWIGRSEGAEIDFALTTGEKLTVFTTRPDTLFGATYLVAAPEHPVLLQLKESIQNWDAEILPYMVGSQRKSEIERTTEGKEKTGVELKGVKAINPATKEEIPIYVADYVLAGYGTGAIMAVPAHDERDFAFAKKFNLPIKQVIASVHTRLEGMDAVRPDARWEDRDAVMCIVKHWEKDEYLVLQWKDHPEVKTFIAGGIESGEDAVAAGAREITEETGYIHPRFARQVGGINYSEFYHQIKKVNRRARFTYLYFELVDGEQQEISIEDKKNHEVLWKPKEEVLGFISNLEKDIVWKNFLTETPYTGEGILANSGEFDGLESEEAKKKITEHVGGRLTTTYKIKDWVFSRQRYWGEPIPIVHCPKDGPVGVPEEQLPVLLPEVESYEPSGTGESPLASIPEWVITTCPTCGGPAKRETNTMPQWAGSSWYYLRFMDPHNNEALVGKDKEKYWAPVDVYVGGDHAVRHLIYARFWHKFLYDIGVVSTIEPFARLEFLGFILAEDGRKMSKRYGNIINPEAVVAQYGADAFRTYEMFMGPFENTVAWSTASIAGTTRFIERVWRAQERVAEYDVPALDVVLNQTIKKVGDDIEAFKFNTAVSQLMILLNAIEKEDHLGKQQWKIFVRLLAPFAPHLAEELWERSGESKLIYQSAWPEYDGSKLAAATVLVAVQVNGKTRATIELAAQASQAEALKAARANESVAKWLKEGGEAKAIYVPGKIVSFVVKKR
jgi:leucyl-tRNA synthetase